MTQPKDTGRARWQAEVLRRTAAALHHRMVGVWQVAAGDSLVLVATNMPDDAAWDAAPEVGVALRHLHTPATRGSRWVAGLLAEAGQWGVAPVRDAPPDPPPHMIERRSHERLALELAALCLGLSDQLARAGEIESPDLDLAQQFTERIGSFAQEVADPLRAAKATVAHCATMLKGAAQLDRALRKRLLDEVRDAARELENATSLVVTVQDRARAVLAQGDHFDVVRVAWSCVESERPWAEGRGTSIGFKTRAHVVPVRGDAGELRRALTSLIHAVVEMLGGGPGPAAVALENVGPMVRITVRAPSAGAPPRGLDEVRRTIESRFGGSLTATSAPARGAVFTVWLPVSTHRFRHPRLRWGR